MQINSLTDSYAVAGQITPGDIAAIKAAGYVTVVCNRPDTEVTAREDSAAIRSAAAAAGLAFTYNPVQNGALTGDNVEAHRRAIDQSEGPVFAYCRSGMRSSVVWALSQAGRMQTEDLIAAAARGGYDLSGLRGQIDAASGG